MSTPRESRHSDEAHGPPNRKRKRESRKQGQASREASGKQYLEALDAIEKQILDAILNPPPLKLCDKDFNLAIMHKNYWGNPTKASESIHTKFGKECWKLDETLPYLRGTGGEMLIRPEYRRIADLIERSEESGIRGFVVQGQPGIGKSVLQLCLLLWYLLEERPVIFCRVGSAYLFNKEGVYTITRRALYERPDTLAEFCPQNTPVLFDNGATEEPPPTTFIADYQFILIHSISSNQTLWTSWYKRYNVLPIILETWDNEEMMTCARSLPHFHHYLAAKGPEEQEAAIQDEINKRVRIAGPVARYVLGPSFTTFQFKQQNEIGRMDIFNLLKSQFASDHLISPELFVLHRQSLDHDVDWPRYGILSEVAATAIITKLSDLSLQALNDIGVLLSKDKSTRELAGIVYERYVLATLASSTGRRFDQYPMTIDSRKKESRAEKESKAETKPKRHVRPSPTANQMDIPPLWRQLYDTAATRPGRLYIPKSHNNAWFAGYWVTEDDEVHFVSTSTHRFPRMTHFLQDPVFRGRNLHFWLVVPEYREDKLGPVRKRDYKAFDTFSLMVVPWMASCYT
ncbi:hypothetical protein C8J56DRAFT_1026145 [Mycena floridula]|nr:hypothetical protein C8J56DRAFT_1026145 [Mycena floridula]